MELRMKDYVRVLYKRLWLIALAAVLFGGGAALYHALYSVPQYEAGTKLVVGNLRASESAGAGPYDYNEINFNLMLIDTYAEIITSPAVMNKVAAEHPEWGLTAKDLIKRTKIATSPKSQVMTLTVRDPSPERAVAAANAVAATFRQQIPGILSVDNVAVLSEASLEDALRPVTHGMAYKVVVAVLLSLVVSIAAAFVWEYMDDSIKSESDIERHLGQPTLTVVRQLKRGQIRKDLKKSRKAALRLEQPALRADHKA